MPRDFMPNCIEYSIANYFISYSLLQFGINSIVDATVDIYNKVVSYRISSHIIKQYVLNNRNSFIIAGL